MTFPTTVMTLLATSAVSFAFVATGTARPAISSTRLLIGNIGLGPDKDEEQRRWNEANEYIWVEGVDYEVPNHEEYRLSRRSQADATADAWFEKLLASSQTGVLSKLADEMIELFLKPVELINEPRREIGSEDYTPFVTTKLPWTPLVPAFGLEQFGIPIPRRNAEAWRNFDVPGMVGEDYSGSVEGHGTNLELSETDVEQYTTSLKDKGGWLDDDACVARLVYVNGRFAPQLSKTTSFAKNLDVGNDMTPELEQQLSRLTDGFTDELAARVPDGDTHDLISFKDLSKPNHNVGNATTQFAINTQQGTACFAALNTIKTGAVAYVNYPAGMDDGLASVKPLLIVQAKTQNGGALSDAGGVTLHPRILVVAQENCRLSVVQSIVDLDIPDVAPVPVLYNGYSQFFIHENANVTFSYLEESGGIVTGGTEVADDSLPEGTTPPREIESTRPALKNTHLETLDAHVVGDSGSFSSTIMAIGGSGRVRTALSVSLLRPSASTKVSGFCLTGGAQRTEMKTNIHHIAQGTMSRQIQKNMIGGRATGAFRGRIRVEQSAQQTDSQQVSRNVLLSDRCRVLTVPSLEIIADDVTCTHGATVSDLSEEELFYLTARGLSQEVARNLLMYAYAGDIVESIDSSMLGSIDSREGLQKRFIRRLQNLAPQGTRKVKGEYQSV